MMMRAFNINMLPEGDFDFIVHLFDRILLGSTTDTKVYNDLCLALERDELLEGHFFDRKMEIYASRVNGQLMVYEPIVVGSGKTDGKDQIVIPRCYELEHAPYNDGGSNRPKYRRLFVRELIDFMDDLAYVKCAMLYRLEKEGA
ncbi:hypothetical protein F4V43_09570 [Paenibacillus spiritus]|uniref:Uncharacterized protein n=1 Tax=Paenibacillus spiritus TaxID=2496557 RepID=A0A5J5GA64_9BACL|nr:hypothetical protein [Paenibacillus spiritus]KAA9004871.1 hypothetical protein F4V43_09570 [Paenibacillus spiritus]